LKPDEYTAILSYLRENGHPAGATALTADKAEAATEKM
jgi:hypothetical protein